MTYVEVVNVTQEEMILRLPWNQGDQVVMQPGESCQAPENWLGWCKRHGLMTQAELNQSWQESGLDAALQEASTSEASSEDKPHEDEDLGLPPASGGIMFDSNPPKAKRGKRQ